MIKTSHDLRTLRFESCPLINILRAELCQNVFKNHNNWQSKLRVLPSVSLMVLITFTFSPCLNKISTPSFLPLLI